MASQETRSQFDEEARLSLPGKYAPLFLIIVLATFLFFYRLGAYSLLESDEPIYAEVARAMDERHELLTPYWNGEPWFIHPPLYFWCTILAAHLAGWNEFSARFTSALFAIALSALTYFFSLSLFRDRRGALLSSLVLLSSLQVFAQGRMALLDLPFNFFLILALLYFIKNYEAPRLLYSTGFWISCGIATFLKGPLGLCMPLVLGLAFLCVRRELKKLASLFPGYWRLPLIYLLIAAPWYVIMSYKYGKAFYEPVIGYYIFRRIVSPIHDQSGPWHYYFPILIGGFFPWSAFLPNLAVEWVRKRSEKAVTFLIIWCGLSFLFFSIAGTKLPNYIFSLYVPLSIGLSRLFTMSLPSSKAITRGHLFLILISSIGVFAYLHYGNTALSEEYSYMKPTVKLLLLMLMLTPLLSIIAYFIRKRSFPYVLIGSSFLLYIALLNGIIALDAGKPMKPFAEAIRACREPQDKVAVSAGVPGTNNLVFYTRAPVTYCCEKWDKKRFLDTDRGYFYIAEESELPQLQWYARRELYILRRQGGYILITNRVH